MVGAISGLPLLECNLAVFLEGITFSWSCQTTEALQSIPPAVSAAWLVTVRARVVAVSPASYG